MIWLDVIDPKYVLFFRSLIPQLEALDSVLITTRKSEDYDECAELLELFGIKAHAIGGYGGLNKLGKFQARLQRQSGFLELFENLGEIPRLFITGASVDGVQCAYGLGIPIIHFADTPVAGEVFSLSKITILSRLSLPLCTLIFRPFIVPEVCYTSLGLESSQIVPYEFIDVALWLADMPESYEQDSLQKAEFCAYFGLERNLPIVLVREEEYKAHYVKQKLPIIYECVEQLAQSGEVNVLIIPRYGSEELESSFAHLPYVKILKQKLEPKAFYPFIDVLLGGGGTMNLEACYLGIPVISTRSLLLFHDRYLINSGLMRHCTSVDSVLENLRQILRNPAKKQKQIALFEPKKADFSSILPHIERLYTAHSR